MAYRVQIYDANQNFVAQIRNLATFDKQATFLEYGQQLSHWGVAKFRVGTKDPLFKTTQAGDLMKPFANHVKIFKGSGTTPVWQGVIVKNPSRTKYYVDVEARTYEYLLDKVLITHDENDTKYPDDKNNFKHFDSGTMSAAITQLISDAKAAAGSTSFINSITAGTIVNPNFPQGFTDINGNAIGGQAWDFSKLPIKFNYNSVLYVLNAFGIYAKCDFSIDNSLKLNFQTLAGGNKLGLTFTYGLTGQIDDYNIPYDGTKQVNELTGLAANDNGDVLSSVQPNSASIAKYGKLQGVAAYGDIKAQAYLDARTREEVVQLADTPAEIQLMLNDKAYPIGVWGVGDIVTVIVNDAVNQFNAPRQIVSYKVVAKNNGEEQIKLVTNIPPVV